METTSRPFDRRRFLAGGVTVFGGLGLLSARARAAAGLLPWETPGEGEPPRTLLLLELSGGNDGLSTIVPRADERYFAARPRTAVPADLALPLDDYRGFHPHLGGLRRLWEEGALAIVEGTGYEGPNHSHFTSQDIWHTASHLGRAAGDGWISHLLRELYPDDTATPHAVHVGKSLPYSLYSSTHPVVCFDSPPTFRWASQGEEIAALADAPAAPSRRALLDHIRETVRTAETSSRDVRRAVARYEPRAAYPNTAIGSDLQIAAALLSSQIGARVLSVTHYGYDTHEDQKRRHDILMRELDQALCAFLDDVRGTEAGDRVLVMAFSEFGRRVSDNASAGTDHGTAGPMFLAGTPVEGGLYGEHPSLGELHAGDLVHTTDFRRTYATVIREWFGADPARVLGAEYPTLGALKA